uniref:CDH1/2 SANT-Helical linker 1 domain-containing protein n=1 Tax=Panagrolaimus superbus TaxID=310955 RepID=A0A914Y6M8_9BILA
MDTTGKTVLSKNAVPNPKVPFEKADLNAILKFGAEELFREKEGEEQEPEVDIDDILTRAETRECENQANDNELLSAFKYANFALDEEKDIAAIGTAKSPVDVKPEKDWDQIIPEEQLQKLKEEEKKKAEQELNLAPRQRNKIYDAPNLDDPDPDGKSSKYAEESSEDEDEKSGKRGPYKKKVLFNFTEVEIKKFAKALKKFAHPLERLDAIAQDAELEEHSTAEMDELTKEILKRCDEASNETEKSEDKAFANGKKKPDRGPVVKVGPVDIYVRPILKQHNDLEALHMFMKKQQEGINPNFKLPQTPKAQHGWDVEWDVVDDISILRGIYKYGCGSWESIKMDPDFGLDGKIWIKDKIKKPQPKHLQCRVDYLLKLLAKSMDPPTSFKRIPEKKKVKRKESDVPKKKKSDTFEPIKKKAKKDSEKLERSEKKKDKNDKSFADGKKVKKEPQDMHTKIIVLPVKDRYAEELNDQIYQKTFKESQR